MKPLHHNHLGACIWIVKPRAHGFVPPGKGRFPLHVAESFFNIVRIIDDNDIAAFEKKLGSIFHPPPLPRAPVETRQPTPDELLKLQPNTDPDGMERL